MASPATGCVGWGLVQLELVPKALKVLRAHLGEGDEVNP
jgi:hypothetical protein